MRNTSNPSKVIQNNWLVNPTGKPDGFRGADWLVELNNLYTKVIYGGAGSNYTIKCIIQESILIDLYWECHIIVENGFYLTDQWLLNSVPCATCRFFLYRSDENYATKHK
jgi:hypothetical protein